MAAILSGTYYYTPNSPVAGYPCTMACWFKPTTAAGGTMMSLGGSDGDALRLVISAAGPIQITAQTDGGSSATAATSTNFTAGQWNHITAVAASATSRSAYLNAGGVGNNTTSRLLNSLNGFSIGVALTGNSMMANPAVSGHMAEVAMWNVALSVSEIRSLASGMSPLFVRPQSLVTYYPMAGNVNNFKTGFMLTGTAAEFRDAPRSYGW